MAALTGTDQPLLLTVGDQRIIWSNEAAARLFETERGNLVGQSMKEVLALSPGAVVEACQAVTTQGYLHGNVDILTAAGNKLPTRFRALSLGGDALHVIAFSTAPNGEPQPLAPSRLAFESLPISAEIAAAVGHEIRMPLATALVYLGIIQQALDGGEQRVVRSALAIAKQEISRIERLVTRVTEMQGLGFPVMRPRLMDLGKTVTEVVKRTAMGGDLGVIRTEIGPGNFIDCWDESAIDQIVGNLLSNALKFGRGRPVDVTVERHGGIARLSVRDRGIGVPGAEQGQIFDRRGRSRQSRAPGLGLGLWFVRALAEAHGGTVALRSRPGEGSTFTVTFRPFPLRAGLGMDAPGVPPSPRIRARRTDRTPSLPSRHRRS